MFEERDEALERLIGAVRRPVRFDPSLDRRIMQRIADDRGALGSMFAAAWRWLAHPRRLAVSPLAALATTAAAALVFVLWPRTSAGPAPLPEFQFVLVAPQAVSVSLVGDFNDWDPARTPMHPAVSRALWTTAIPLEPGRHRYAFLVDGGRWIPDPAAPAAADDEFGMPSSVVTVGESE